MSVMVQLSQKLSAGLGLSIFYACRSESSNKSLVVLDKDPSCSKTTWRFLAKLDHHWHQLSLIHQAVSVRVQNLKNNTSGLLRSLSNNFFSPKKFLRPENGQSWGREQWLLPAPSDGVRPQHHEQPCAAPPCPPSFPCMPRVLHVGRG